MEKKIFAGIFITLLLFSVNSQAYGEPGEQIDISEYLDKDGNSFQADFGEVIQTDKIIFEISKDSNVQVTHVVAGGAWPSAEPKLIQMLPGKHSNIDVRDEDGDPLRPIGFVGETVEDSEYIIAGQKASRAHDLHATYDLENYLELNDDGLWTKHIYFPHDVMVYFDDEIELIFVNSRPIDVSEAKGINCMGCDMRLEFFDKSEPVAKTVIIHENKFEELSNTGEEFVVEILSDGEVGDLNFTEELNYLGFNTSKENQIFALKFPLDLLLSPYYVYVTEFDQEILVESDKIRKTEYGQTDTHANLSFRPMIEGVIHVVGSSQMEHEEFLDRLEKRMSQSVVQTETETNTINENQELEEKTPSEQLYDSWGDSNPSVNNSMDNTVIFVIIGVISAIIIGVIIKLKKN